MLPIRWDPFRDLGTLHREIDDLFRKTFGSLAEPGGERMPLLAPKVNTFIKDDVFHLEAELPGLEREDIDLTIEGNVLTLSGERKMKKERKEQDYLLRESSYGSFRRSMTLPEGVDADQVHARYENGMLTVTMPVTGKLPGGRKVMIEGGAGSTGEKHVH